MRARAASSRTNTATITAENSDSGYMAYGHCPYDVGLRSHDVVNVSRQPPPPERYMSRTIRCAVLFLAVTTTACSSSVTEPTAAPKCTAKSQNSSQSCVSLDYINPRV
jgi:hypothetical protein